jgi:hypothetical protein
MTLTGMFMPDVSRVASAMLSNRIITFFDGHLKQRTGILIVMRRGTQRKGSELIQVKSSVLSWHLKKISFVVGFTLIHFPTLV